MWGQGHSFGEAKTAPRGRADGATQTPDGAAAGFRPHVGAGASPFLALKPTPSRARSFNAGIAGKLKAFAAATGNGKWPHLPRADIARRLSELAKDPSFFNQAGLNGCGPAAAFYLFGKRYTERFVDFATTLYDSGAAKFGSIGVSGDGLFDRDPATMNWAGQQPPRCDWMLISSLLRSLGGTSGFFDGTPSDDVSAITLPGEFETWMKSGIGYTTVMNQANKIATKTLDHLRMLQPQAGVDHDVVILINVTNIEAGSKRQGKNAVKGKSVQALNRIQGGVMAHFPNHYFVLTDPVSEANGEIKATGWSWGQHPYELKASEDTWDDSYYGAFICVV